MYSRMTTMNKTSCKKGAFLLSSMALSRCAAIHTDEGALPCPPATPLQQNAGQASTDSSECWAVRSQAGQQSSGPQCQPGSPRPARAMRCRSASTAVAASRPLMLLPTAGLLLAALFSPCPQCRWLIRPGPSAHSRGGRGHHAQACCLAESHNGFSCYLHHAQAFCTM